jgi:hypothetical protein
MHQLSKVLINNRKPREKNAPGLASLEGARAVIGTLRKFLNVLLVCFEHLLRLHLVTPLGVKHAFTF